MKYQLTLIYSRFNPVLDVEQIFPCQFLILPNIWQTIFTSNLQTFSENLKLIE